jgi:hypothetical protein
MARYERFRSNPKNIDLIIHETQRMWQLGFVMLTLVILVSCSVTKTTKSDVKSNVSSESGVSKEIALSESNQSADHTRTSIDSTSIKALQLFEVWKKGYTSQLKTYDTSKPVDPKTGTPPLASELNINNVESGTKNTQENGEVKYNQIKQNDIVTNLTKQLKSKSDSIAFLKQELSSRNKSTEKRINLWWVLVLISAFLLVSIQFRWYKCLSFIWEKIIPKFVSLFKSIFAR